jgi:hypothetical protein
VIAKQEYYLVVNVQRLAVFESLDEALGGETTVYAAVEWHGVQRKTRNVRRPNVNEILYFHMPIEEELRKGDPNRLAEYI